MIVMLKLPTESINALKELFFIHVMKVFTEHPNGQSQSKIIPQSHFETMFMYEQCFFWQNIDSSWRKLSGVFFYICVLI